MNLTNLAQYLPGVAFLFLISMMIAIPYVIFVRQKTFAIVLSAMTSATILKIWAYLAIGGFDLAFLILVIVVSLLAAVIVAKLSISIRWFARPIKK